MKTYKRELAIALFIPLFFTVWQGDSAMAEVLVWPTFSFAALAFGLDWHGKQLQQTPSGSSQRGNQRSRQYTNREDDEPEYRKYPEYGAEDSPPSSKDH